MKDVVQDTDADLSPMHILVLRILVEEGQLSQSSLVKKLGRDKAQITRLVTELVRRELVFKTRDEHDKRSFILAAAPSVQDKVKYFIQKESELVADMLQDISISDITTLAKLIPIMLNNLTASKQAG